MKCKCTHFGVCVHIYTYEVLHAYLHSYAQQWNIPLMTIKVVLRLTIVIFKNQKTNSSCITRVCKTFEKNSNNLD